MEINKFNILIVLLFFSMNCYSQSSDTAKIVVWANCIAKNISPSAAYAIFVKEDSKSKSHLESAMEYCGNTGASKSEANFNLAEKAIYYEVAITHKKVRSESEFKEGFETGLCSTQKIPLKKAKDIYLKRSVYTKSEINTLINSCKNSNNLSATDKKIIGYVLSSYLIKAGHN
jgi:hypothetical protein